MAHQRAVVPTASPITATGFSTAVWSDIWVRRWVHPLTAVAAVLGGYVGTDVLAGRTTPSAIKLGGARPLNSALEVEDVVALFAAPDSVWVTEFFAADEALQDAAPDHLLKAFSLGAGVHLKLEGFIITVKSV